MVLTALDSAMGGNADRKPWSPPLVALFGRELAFVAKTQRVG